MHMAYKALGGNGAVDHIIAELNELPKGRRVRIPCSFRLSVVDN